jgi:hypothetical protein
MEPTSYLFIYSLFNNSVSNSHCIQSNDIFTCRSVNIDGVWDWILDLLTTYTQLGTTSNCSATAGLHNSQITTVHTNPCPACCVFTSHSLATASNSWDSSASRAHVLASQTPIQNWLGCKWASEWVILRLTISRPVYLEIKHPSGAYDQIFITVRQLRVCWCRPPSLTRGQVCLFLCKIYNIFYILHVILCYSFTNTI